MSRYLMAVVYSLWSRPAVGSYGVLNTDMTANKRLLAFGTYPEISLLDARRKRDDARKLLANNVDPGCCS